MPPWEIRGKVGEFDEDWRRPPWTLVAAAVVTVQEGSM